MPHLSRRSALALLAGAAAAPFASSTLAASDWPARPIKLVVPFPPSGGTDLAARILAERLGAVLGQSVYIENKPGASTIIGVMEVVQAQPDGYTLLLSGSSSFTVNPAVRPHLAYDPFRQLTPIAMAARAPLVLLTPASSPYQTLHALLADAAKHPGAINYATFGPGSGPHLATELLAAARGVKLTPVAYKGSSDASMALVRGEIGLGLDTLASAAPQIHSGKVRALAINAAQRSDLLPGVPSYGELGLSSALFEGWYALAGPAHLPTPIVAKLDTVLRQVMADPTVRQRMLQQSLEPVMVGAPQLREIMEREVTRYRAVAARADIRLD